MKKLMILAAAALLAAGVQAAAVGWSCTCGAVWKDGSYSIFVLGQNGVKEDSAAAIAQIQALVASGGLEKADSLAFGSGTVTSAGLASAAVASSGKSITYSGSGTDTYTALIFVEDATGKKAGYTATKNITMENDSTGKTWNFTNQASNLTSNTFDVKGSAAPEPTSGLLLLLGVAGLALRRRRA